LRERHADNTRTQLGKNEREFSGMIVFDVHDVMRRKRGEGNEKKSDRWRMGMDSGPYVPQKGVM
jgi:hypothetical protein